MPTYSATILKQVGGLDAGCLKAWHSYWLRAHVDCELMVPSEVPGLPACMEALRVERSTTQLATWSGKGRPSARKPPGTLKALMARCTPMGAACTRPTWR